MVKRALINSVMPLTLLKILLITLLMLISLPAYTAELSVNLNKTESEMGKYFLATISYQGYTNPGTVNLSEWQESFYVDIRQTEHSELQNGLIQSDLHVRLYPRQSGKVTLTSLALGGAIAKSQQLIVSPSVRNNIDATPVLQPMQQQYWTDQAILIRIDIALHDPRNEVIADDFETKDFVVRTLDPQRLQSKSGDFIRLQWVLLTPNKGQYNVEIPSIQQRGRGRFRYYLPGLKLNIKPIPAYLPVTVAVGELTVNSEIVKQKNSTPYWQIKINNKGRLPESIEGLQTFFDQAGITKHEIQSEKLTHSHSGNLTQLYKINIPDWYFSSPGQLKLTYFNTRTGRLENLVHPLPEFWNIPGYAKITGLLMFVLGIFYAGYKMNKLVQKVRKWRRFRLLIKQSTSADQLRKLLLNTYRARTLSEWAGRQHNSLPLHIATDLNALCFARTSLLKMDSIKTRCLLHFSYRRMPEVS